MTPRERIATIAGEHLWRETVHSSPTVLQIERRDETLTIGLLDNDGGLGDISYSPRICVTRPVRSGLPGVLAIIRRPTP